MKLIDRLFPKKFRIVSSITGPGYGYQYRSRIVAAFWATSFEYTEWRLGLPSQKWTVERKTEK